MEQMMQLLEGQETMARMGWSPYLHNPRLPDLVRRYRGPALVIWGKGDRVLPHAHARAWAELLGAPLEIVEKAGHLPAIEQPDETASLIDSFVGSG
jgi:pimeloyl-ACP methyl ester carboxylesterase